MKKLSLFTALAVLLSFSSCEEDSILGCTDTTAINYDALATEDDGTCENSIAGCTDVLATNFNELANQNDGSCEYPTNADLIIGSWTSDSSEVRMMLSEETLTIIAIYSEDMTPEEFEEEFGFLMPTSDEEWQQILEEGVIVTGEGYEGTVTITNSIFTINQMDGDVLNLEYELVNGNRIEFIDPNFDPEEDDYEYFDVINVNNTNLTLFSTLLFEADEGTFIETEVTIYLSK